MDEVTLAVVAGLPVASELARFDMGGAELPVPGSVQIRGLDKALKGHLYLSAGATELVVLSPRTTPSKGVCYEKGTPVRKVVGHYPVAKIVGLTL